MIVICPNCGYASELEDRIDEVFYTCKMCKYSRYVVLSIKNENGNLKLKTDEDWEKGKRRNG